MVGVKVKRLSKQDNARLQRSARESRRPPRLVIKARRPGREVQRVNVDFPPDLLRAIDSGAKRSEAA